MREVILHGTLAKKYGKSFKLDIATAADAIRALAANFPSFIEDMRLGSFHVVMGKKIDTGIALDERECGGFNLGASTLHIAPVVAGSKRSGVLKAVLGVALLGVAFAFSGGALATPLLGGAGFLGGITYGNLAMIGAAMALSGISSLLSPEEKTSEKQDSFTFGGPGNAYEQGSPIPLVYGRVITGGVLVSAGIDIEPIAVGA